MNRTLFLRLSLFLLAWLLGAGSAHAQESDRSRFRVHGRLLDAHGDPCHATVRLVKDVALNERPSYGLGGRFHDCGYAVEVDQPGVYRLEAMSSSTGTAVIERVCLTEAAPDQQIDLCLSGFGVVRGTIQDVDGRPIPGVCVMALEAGRDVDSFNDGFGSVLGRFDPLTQNGGLSRSQARTDAEGHFEIRHLQPTSFDLYAQFSKRRPYRFRGSPIALAVPADGLERAQRFEGAYLVVRVTENGSPFDFGDPLELPRMKDLGKWGKKVELICQPHHGDPAGASGFFWAGAGPVSGTQLELGVFVFPVYAGNRYILGVKGGEHTARLQEIYVSPGSGRLDMKLDLRRKAHGTVKVTALNALGAPLMCDVRMRLETVVGGMEVLSEKGNLGWGGTHEVGVAPGAYRLVIQGVPRYSTGCDGGVRLRSHCGRFEKLIHVTSGEVTGVACTLPEGARLEVELSGKTMTDGRGRSRFPMLRLTLEREHGSPVHPTFFEADLRPGVDRARKQFRSRMLQVGETALSEPLPSGRFLLRGYTEGGKTASVPVDLKDGEITKVALRF